MEETQGKVERKRLHSSYQRLRSLTMRESIISNKSEQRLETLEVYARHRIQLVFRRRRMLL